LVRGAYLTATHLKVYADGLEAKALDQTPRGGGLRGPVTEFSNSSRRRLFKTLARVRSVGKTDFLTLTYPKAFPDDPETPKRHLDMFIKALQRASPSVGYLWRLEYQKRGAPHFHLLLFNFQPSWKLAVKRRWVRITWFRIAGGGDRKHLRRGADLREAQTRKRLYSYVSKYVAKPAEENKCSPETTGRWWGYGGEIDLSPYLELTLSARETVQLKRLCRAWLKACRGKKGAAFAKHIAGETVGFTIFGLGAESQEIDQGQTIYRMLRCILENG
jgi:hypothetical protein